MRRKCFFNKMNRAVRNEKGAAAVFTLCVILVLTALGTIVLATSAANIKMSGKIINWSYEFYEMDTKAEALIDKIDNVLIAAEKDARQYVINRWDRMDNASFSAVNLFPSSYSYNMGTGAQNFFHEYYKYDWTYEAAPGIYKEYTLDDYIIYKADGTLYTISPNSSLSAEGAYQEDLKTYTKELFERVYFHLLSRRLEDLHLSPYDDDFVNDRVVIKSANADYGSRDDNQSFHCTYRYYNISTSLYPTLQEVWDNIKPFKDSVGLYICVKGGTADDPKEVHVELNVILPNYEMIMKSLSKPILGNPIWTNALSVEGNITVEEGASVDILGDIYASDIDGTGDGLTVKEGADVEIRGNVYTSGNVQIKASSFADGGSLVIHTKSAAFPVSYDMKKLVYENDYFHDGTYNNFANFSSYTTDTTDDNIPFIFKDAEDTGNVYCESLLVEEGVKGANLKVEGNLWTRDDIQMDGEASTISVGSVEVIGGQKLPKYSYIGLNSESGVTDPNASSSVINNFPFNNDGSNNSVIVINSNFVVPGVAFYNFYTAAGFDNFYKSVESMTSRTAQPTPTITGYLYDGVGHSEYANADGDIFNLINGDGETKRKALVDFINGLPAGIRTNVRTNLSLPDGFVAGVALVQPDTPLGDSAAIVYTHSPGSLTGAIELPNSGKNSVAFGQLTSPSTGYALMNIFTAKTKKLGTYDTPYDPDVPTTVRSFNDFIDTTVPVNSPADIVKIPNNGELNIDTVTSGIVYCNGDMTVTGSPGKEFRGTIICKGNLKIKNNVKITYDESVIFSKIENKDNVRLFFKKGEMGMKLSETIEYSTTSGRRVAKRYKVMSWQEISV